jgi:pimeloyl-ACP methyl ester carboxylesterase
LAIQGEEDEYGSMEQIDRIAGTAPDVELRKLAHCRHSPHRDRPEAVIESVSKWIRQRKRTQCVTIGRSL